MQHASRLGGWLLGLAIIVLCISTTGTAGPIYSLSNVVFDPKTPPVSGKLIGFYDGSQLSLSGSNVTNWIDQAPLLGANNALQANAPQQPTLVTGGLNGRNYVHFSGGQVLQSAAFGGPEAQPNTIFVVSRLAATQTGPNPGLPFFYDGVGGQRNTLLLNNYTNGSNTGTPYMYANASLIGGSVSNLDQFKIWSTVWNGATSRLDVDGSLVLSGNPGTAGLDGVAIGNSPPNGNNYGMTGDIAELLIFNDLLTTDEYNQVGTYLELKYGLNTAFNFPLELPLAPEPGSIALFGAALAVGLAVVARKRMRRD